MGYAPGRPSAGLLFCKRDLVAFLIRITTVDTIHFRHKLCIQIQKSFSTFTFLPPLSTRSRGAPASRGEVAQRRGCFAGSK